MRACHFFGQWEKNSLLYELQLHGERFTDDMKFEILRKHSLDTEIYENRS